MHPRRHTGDIAKIGVRKFHRASTRVCSVRFLTRQTLSTDFMGGLVHQNHDSTGAVAGAQHERKR